MINAGKELRKGFSTLLETFGGQVIIHKDFNCENSNSFEAKGMKNGKREDSSIIIFQFLDKIDVNIGDVLQQKNSSEYWKTYKVEEKRTTDVLVNYTVCVKKIDSKGNPA